MNQKVNIHVDNLENMGKRFTDAWNKASRGKRVRESHLTFFSLESLLKTLTPKRLELLRYVHRHEAISVKALAEELKRDYKNVYNDVIALEALELVRRSPNRISAPWSQLQASFIL